jgi:hypothetical protein
MHQMGWKSFQQLCHTICREILGQTVESFLDNNDGGRDGAFAGAWQPSDRRSGSGAFVLQCKHTTRPSHNLALSDISDELDKAERLARKNRCEVYLLVTNAGISGKTEESIRDALLNRGVRHTVVLGSTWINQTIAESPRLRRLVPRLYGLGDLTQILDGRAYEQAQSVLDSMSEDLAKVVRTQTFERAASALERASFVLLTGAPSTGKTTIAAQLILGACDEFQTSTVKLDRISDLTERWNPNDAQLFWADDVFGTTHFDDALARDWNTAQPKIHAALAANSRFILTSRDYIFNAARRVLKAGSHPILHEAEVVVNVADLSADERQQILYNHLRQGRQTNEFLAALTPHLGHAANHPGFTPELARRVADPAFTKQTNPSNFASVSRFFAKPKQLLRDVLDGLDDHAIAALGLIFISQNWLPSPIALDPSATDLLVRLDATHGGVTKALDNLNGSLVRHSIANGETGWSFAHPTMIDSFAQLLARPELLTHFIAACPIDALLQEVTCGDVGLQGALVIPEPLFDRMLNRIQESDWQVARFLTHRCSPEFLRLYVAANPDLIPTEPFLELESSDENRLVAALHKHGLCPDEIRSQFAEDMTGYLRDFEDFAVAWDADLQSILNAHERGALDRIIDGMLDDPATTVDDVVSAANRLHPSDLAHKIDQLEQLVDYLQSQPRFRGTERIGLMEKAIGEWRTNEDQAKLPRPLQSLASDTPVPSPLGTDLWTPRSIFDDLTTGRTNEPKRKAVPPSTGYHSLPSTKLVEISP